MEIEVSQAAKLPTAFGLFNIVSFKEITTGKDHFVVYMGAITKCKNILLRIHSECLTGDVFSSRKCDCGEQLDTTMELVAREKSGMIIYLRQEGRGIGLFNKVNAYALQDGGLNTIDANLKLGFGVDLRTYDVVKHIMDYFGIMSVRLLSNNPDKSTALMEMGITISEIIPLIIERNEHNDNYLNTKKNLMSHKL